MFRIYAALAVVILAAFVLLEACESSPSHSTVTKVDDARSLTSLISIEGSSTMISLVKSWSQDFKKTNPEVPFSITSNDSTGGVTSLMNRNTDIALSSRDLTPAEIAQAHAKGFKLSRYTVARDAIAFIVNSKNPVEGLKLDQIEKVYLGQINNWAELGGKSIPIDRLTREKQSGTFAYFQEHVMHGKECSASTKLVPSVGQTIDKVAADPGAIAYVGLHHAVSNQDKVKILGLKLMEKSEVVKPSAASSVENYPLSRPLLIFSDENPKPSTKKFIDFCMSDAGQKQVSASGYIPIR